MCLGTPPSYRHWWKAAHPCGGRRLRGEPRCGPAQGGSLRRAVWARTQPRQQRLWTRAAPAALPACATVVQPRRSASAATPENGSAASSAPYTAIPGSIEAQLAGTPIAGANPAISLQDAFRGARLVQGLLNRPQQPQTNPYMLMNQQQQPGLVSYEELLGLLNRPMASTPNVYQALAPQQNPYSLI